MDVDAIPKLYRPVYDRAMRGKSRRDAMHAFCLMCVGWQISEVYLCTAPDCPLFPYRPQSRATPGASEGLPEDGLCDGEDSDD